MRQKSTENSIDELSNFAKLAQERQSMVQGSLITGERQEVQARYFKKQTKKKFSYKHPFPYLSEDFLNRVDNIIIEYRKPQNAQDAQLNKIRKCYRAQMLRYLIYGVEELKEKALRDKSLEKFLEKFRDQEVLYTYCFDIIEKVDEKLIANCNQGEVELEHRQYRNQWRNILQGLKKPQNKMLRQHILVKDFDAQDLYAMEEHELCFEQPMPRSQKEQMPLKKTSSEER